MTYVMSPADCGPKSETLAFLHVYRTGLIEFLTGLLLFYSTNTNELSFQLELMFTVFTTASLLVLCVSLNLVDCQRLCDCVCVCV